MSKLSLLDKLSLFFDVAKESAWSILILIILIILVYIYSDTNKKTIKRNKIIYIGFSLISLVALLICYLPSISKIFDNMINNLFIVIYFPSLAVYFAAIIATSIILWVSLFSYKTSQLIKRLNLVIYLVINYLFALLLYVINNNKLDIFNSESIYTNKQATALIELTSVIFVVWIIFLIIYKLVLTYIRKDYREPVKKVIKVVKKLPENYKSTEVPNKVYGNIPQSKVIEKEVKHLPENYLSIAAPEIVYGNTSKVKEKPYIEITAPKVVYGTIPNKLKLDDKKLKVYDDMLSLEDYKLLLKLLKEHKKKEVKEKVEEEFVQPDLTELDNLFRSIR